MSRLSGSGTATDYPCPELQIIQGSGWTEYRLHNWHTARDGTTRIIKGNSWTWFDALIVLGLGLVISRLRRSNASTTWYLAVLSIAIFLCYRKTNTVLWESVVVIPFHGIQLETCRGLPDLPLFTTRRFIPLASYKDIIINEALYGWNVRYYMACLVQLSSGEIKITLIFENILPLFPVLHKVYKGIMNDLRENL